MKKKELISKIDSLITSLNEMSAELKLCKEENASLKLKIEELLNSAPKVEAEVEAEPVKEIVEEAEPEILPEVEEVSEEQAEEPISLVEEEVVEEPSFEESKEEILEETPEKTEEKTVLNILPVTEEVVLPDSIMEFGAEIIGKIVIESAKYADQVAASATLNKKELLNLIMGKSEVCKAEILSIVTSDNQTETKISLINAELSEATDYFKSVVAQI